MNEKMLPSKWAHEDIIMRDATIEDKDRLNEICKSWDQKTELEGEGFSDDYIENCILGKDELPPIENADNKNYAIKVVENTEGETVGYINIYQGYPDDSCLWIGMFMIDKKYQHNNYGSKAIHSLIEMAKTKGWTRCGLGVYLKNWTGLRFWVNNGFKEIGGVFGDKLYSNTTFSLISLYQNI